MNTQAEAMRRTAELITKSSRIVGFAGAGVGTESGISDYRSKGGLYDRFTPVYYDEFLPDEEKRRLYWQRKIEMWSSLRDTKPNAEIVCLSCGRIFPAEELMEGLEAGGPAPRCSESGGVLKPNTISFGQNRNNL